jgi:hypothetical protein
MEKKPQIKEFEAYLLDNREGSKGQVIGVTKKTHAVYALQEKELKKKKMEWAIQFKPISKDEGEKLYLAQFEPEKKAGRPKKEEK